MKKKLILSAVALLVVIVALVKGCGEEESADGALYAEVKEGPLVIDIEDADNNNSVSDRVVISRLKAMASTLKKAGYKVMIYTNGNGMKKYYRPAFKGEYLWLCTFSDPDDVKQRGHTFQQYSHWGSCDGVDGDVDLNIFMGTSREWEAWLEKVK